MNEPAVPLISHEDLLAGLSDPAMTVLNVLPFEIYRESHIPGTGNLPFADVELKAAGMLPDKQADIVVYCASPD